MPRGVAPDDSYATGVPPGMLDTTLGCGLSLPAGRTDTLAGWTGPQLAATEGFSVALLTEHGPVCTFF
ncbi:hypothetical protein [Amycolatopsis palatopharyngis]|uniref:hypothetical protein n=1 Tax=Amycolatopsis palatopharyngis TaxID=187982 RepID=UPI0013BEA944|nr:hypothetical protein [Amycolatopsis palatopharyngis]